MDLKEFVSETIKQIIDGVVAAQEYGRAKGARVNPLHLPVRNSHGVMQSVNYRADVAHPVEFDVALSTSDGTQTKGGVGLIVGILTLGSSGQSKNDNEVVSRVKFTIPVVLPTEKDDAK
ncbi:MAG TPA: hypothetical protein VIM11_17560 [Tepidisphaeraceae bacterium]|jgi:hypothetical protein